jgi:hypothetical protein
MRSLERRINKLERILADDHGLIPHSDKWLAYWSNRMDRLLTEPDFTPTEKMPLEAARLLIQSSPESE